MGHRSGIGSKKKIIEVDEIAAMDAMANIDIASDIDLLFDDNRLISSSILDDALVHKRRPSKREMQAVSSLQYIQDVIKTLPAAGETWHIISNSKFNAWSFAPAIINYLGGYTTVLYCVTWTTNKLNTAECIKIFDEGKIGKIIFVVGNYFRTRESAVFANLAEQLMRRKQTLISGEHHAKIMLLQNADNYIVIESSANLCANPRTENFTYSNDRALFQFHQAWIDKLAEKK